MTSLSIESSILTLTAAQTGRSNCVAMATSGNHQVLRRIESRLSHWKEAIRLMGETVARPHNSRTLIELACQMEFFQKRRPEKNSI